MSAEVFRNKQREGKMSLSSEYNTIRLFLNENPNRHRSAIEAGMGTEL